MPVNQGPARLCLVLMLAAAACAASLGGVVQDPTGAPISGAKVSLDIARLAEAGRTSVTGSAGAYIFSGLAAGTYSLTVQSPGFLAWKKADIRIDDQADLQLPTVMLQLSPICGSGEERLSLPTRALAAIERFLTGRPRNIKVCE